MNELKSYPLLKPDATVKEQIEYYEKKAQVFKERYEKSSCKSCVRPILEYATRYKNLADHLKTHKDA